MEAYKSELEQVLKFLKDNPTGLTLTQISALIKINRNSVAKYLDVLTTQGKVEFRHIGPAKVFALTTRTPVSALLDYSSDAIITLDSSLKIISVNNVLARKCKVEAQSLIGRELGLTQLSKVLSVKLQDKVSEALAGKSSKFRDKVEVNGAVCHFKVSVLPTRFEDGTDGVTLVFEDVSEQVEYEQKLKASEEKFRTLAETVPASIFIYQGNSIVYSNEAAVRMSGYSKEELLGMDFVDFIHPEFKAKVEECRKLRLQGKPVPNRYEVKIIRKDGQVLWIDYLAQNIMYAGKTAVLGTAFDVTKKKSSVKEYELSNRIFDQTIHALALTDIEGVARRVNCAFEKLTGTKKEQVVGKKLSFFEQSKSIGANSELWDTILAGKIYRKVEVRQKGNGQKFKEMLTVMPIKDDKGQVTNFFCFVMDADKEAELLDFTHKVVSEIKK